MVAPKVGEVFLYRGTYSQQGHSWTDDRHIHIVVKIDQRGGDAYLVPLSTHPVLGDKTCEIDVNDGCPLVTKRCFVAYFYARKAALGAPMKDDCLIREAPAGLLAKVVAGVQTSTHTPPWFRDSIFPIEPRKIKIHRAG